MSTLKQKIEKRENGILLDIKKYFQHEAGDASSLKGLRIWIPAFSRSHEVYAWAILAGELGQIGPIQVFGTGRDERIIFRARRGIYSEAEMRVVPKKHRSRTFEKLAANKYRIRDFQRECCIFATHEILQDPPISRLNLIDARYLHLGRDKEVLKKIFSALSFGLKKDGLLLLPPEYPYTEVNDYFVLKNSASGLYGKKEFSESNFIAEYQPRPMTEMEAHAAPKRIDRRSGPPQSILEELQSLNEELQIKNNELKVAQEETHMLNEELYAINEEICQRNLNLDKLSNDLLNLLESMDLPIIILNTRLNIQRFNRAAANLFNFIKADEGRPITDLRHNIEIPQLPEVVKRVLAGAETQSFEIADKKDHWYMIRFKPYLTTQKKVEGVIITFSDIHTLKTNRDTLEGLVKERTEELLKTREEMQMNKRLADIGLLASTVAHELRTPLAAINIAAANIRKKAPDAMILDRHIDSIGKKVFESDRIIKNLLFYSRIKQPYLDSVKLLEILQECIGQVKYRKEKVDVQVDVRSLGKLFIDADALQLRELFSNLLNNAYDALHEEGGRLDILTYVNKDTVKIVIKDNGIGISEQNIPHIFNPFFTTKAKGTGLGLAVSQQIVQLHKGTIEIKSRVDHGTTVTVELPIQRHTPVGTEEQLAQRSGTPNLTTHLTSS